GGDVENKNVEGGSRFPALTMRYEFKNPNLLVQLHGMLHENRAISNANEEQTKLAWGAGLGTKFNLSGNDAIVFNYYHIAGDNRYMLYSKDNDAFYFDQNRMYLSEFDSVELGYMRKWNENLRSSLSVGSLVYKDSDFSENNPDQNKRLIKARVNLFWTPVEKVDLGVEYTYG
ncbi:DcaP-like protein, partial [Acinetobacter baumannii]|uniref:DcaP family trimeric outer membrane transporter n=1 Tax=Acinetobacter baumannii TaxID=470 RepID=UPI000E131371